MKEGDRLFQKKQNRPTNQKLTEKVCHLDSFERHFCCERRIKATSQAHLIRNQKKQSLRKIMKSLNYLITLTTALTLLPACSNSNDSTSKVETEVNISESGMSFTGPLVDDFSDSKKNSLGIDRQFIDDSSTGGGTKTEYSIQDGVLSAKGEIIPLRGQPGWASTALILNPEGLPQDVSAYQGIRLLVRVNQGTLSVSVNSSEIENFDYHATAVASQPGDEFHEVKVPFTQLKRAWSAQTKLNTKTVTSLSLVAFGVQKGSFDFDFDEISFY